MSIEMSSISKTEEKFEAEMKELLKQEKETGEFTYTIVILKRGDTDFWTLTEPLRKPVLNYILRKMKEYTKKVINEQ